MCNIMQKTYVLITERIKGMENKSATVKVFDTREDVQYSSYSNRKQDVKSAIVIHDNGKGDFLLSKHNLETREEATTEDQNVVVHYDVTSVYNKGLYKISKRQANLLRELPADSLIFKTVLKNVILKSPDLTKLEASRESQDAINEIMDKGKSLATVSIDDKINEEKQKEKEKEKEKQEKESKFVEAVLNKFRGSGKE